MKATVYFTYQLASYDDDYGLKNSVHCNYINKIDIDSTLNKEISIHFDKPDEFKFLNQIGTGTGYSSNIIYLLVQRVYEYETLSSDKWLRFNVTNQITGHESGGYLETQLLTPTELYNTNFKVNLVDYSTAVVSGLATNYDLTYITYPISGTTNNFFSFGDEEYFIGNVSSDISAKIYSMNISIPTTDFNQTNNMTWIEGQPIYVSEVGIYDDNKNLVGIAKLNSPIDVSNNNTIVFGLDF